MKGLRRSVISSCAIWVSNVVFIYFVLVRGVIETGSLDYLVSNLRFSVLFGAAFVVFTMELYERALLPCYEVFIRKQIVDKVTRIDWMQPGGVAPYLPWTSCTVLRISSEQGVFTYPDCLPEDIKDHEVRIHFLRRSKLVMEISIAD